MTDHRSTQAQVWRGWYSTRQWRGLRASQLARCPLCIACHHRGKIVAAAIVDHVKEHKGDPDLFFDPDNLQSLCKPCHDGGKQKAERAGYTAEAGPDGWPTDPRHPANLTGR